MGSFPERRSPGEARGCTLIRHRAPGLDRSATPSPVRLVPSWTVSWYKAWPWSETFEHASGGGWVKIMRTEEPRWAIRTGETALSMHEGLRHPPPTVKYDAIQHPVPAETVTVGSTPPPRYSLTEAQPHLLHSTYVHLSSPARLSSLR